MTSSQLWLECHLVLQTEQNSKPHWQRNKMESVSAIRIKLCSTYWQVLKHLHAKMKSFPDLLQGIRQELVWSSPLLRDYRHGTQFHSQLSGRMSGLDQHPLLRKEKQYMHTQRIPNKSTQSRQLDCLLLLMFIKSILSSIKREFVFLFLIFLLWE